MLISPALRALLDAVGQVEAKGSYNAIYLPAERKLGKQTLTAMTLSQVQALQERMVKVSASSACGRYQFIRKTLAALIVKLRLKSTDVFTPALQDRLAVELMKGRGLNAYLTGSMSREAFCNNLAKEWASLPVVTPVNGKKVGQSYYAGDGLNHALMKPEKILALVDALKTRQPDDPGPEPVPVPQPKPAPKSWWQRLLIALGLGSTAGTGAAYEYGVGLDILIGLGVLALVGGGVAFLIWRRKE